MFCIDLRPPANTQLISGLNSMSPYSIGVIGFNNSGQITTVLSINSTSGHVDQSPPFIIKSPFAGCNIAFDAGDASSSPPRPSLFYIPDGSPMEPASEYAFLSVNVRGDVVHRAIYFLTLGSIFP